MKPIKFPEINTKMAEDQDQYETIPCHITKEGIVVACFEIDDNELKNIIKNKRVWIQIFKGNEKLLQPFNIFILKDYFNSVRVEGTQSYVVDNDVENRINDAVDDLIKD